MAKILIIEDSVINQRLAQAMLKQGNHESLVAGSADDGLEIARRERPDLILIDIQLPGMDGMEATRLLKADPSTAPIPLIPPPPLPPCGVTSDLAAVVCSLVEWLVVLPREVGERGL